MRTTLTLDDDLAAELRERAHRTGRSFKEIVNEALREGLARAARRAPAKPYRLRPSRMGDIAPGLEADRMLALADRIHDEEAARELRSRK